ncbi:MAG: type II secretion system protein [Clostridia bacterium]|nr:type II secretion system protein [Clostridia bacterium]
MRKKSKQSGFTLVELLVAMVCATLAISMIISTLFFITFSTDELIRQSSEGYRIKTVKRYILQQGHTSNPSGDYTVNPEDKTLSYHDTDHDTVTVIVSDTEILDIQFSDDENSNLIYCILVLPNKSYRFVAGRK